MSLQAKGALSFVLTMFRYQILSPLAATQVTTQISSDAPQLNGAYLIGKIISILVFHLKISQKFFEDRAVLNY